VIEMETNNEKIAIIRVRGITGIKHDISKTLKQMLLHKKNFCVVVPKNKFYLGMIQKIKDYVTWGEVDEKVYNSLVEKKGEVYTRRLSDRQGKIKYNRFIEVSGRKIKKYFRLNSPKKGFGRKGIKVSFVKGGGLGYRKDKINELIGRMNY
jgi:large subunit ribosomal protein L30|tara:strand:+ start:20652 stop:21104 length:453 start_codon:yes stop_codon:yes gene_type:complete